ncbi:hypothetical protein [Entomobacter blattae]|uniref:Uncharacterized protein n=1 Tax=Entomobacter blattae TaxID=2762277 RepID=A0A7H1NSN9_9PROT|nr:hypothetical protein [Entomobacter blattae]QNT78799.1 hypothetical protein JGUZn3_15760 [Entomobacter blattae]
MATLTSYNNTRISGLSIIYIATYKGGDTLYDTSFLDDTGSDYVARNYHILLSPINGGSLAFTPSHEDFIPTFYNSVTPSSGQTLIDITQANTNMVNAYGTGSHFSFVLTGEQNGKFFGHSEEDKNTVFVTVSANNTNTAPRSYELQNTLLVLNGTYSVPSFILDYGGNMIWAGDKTLSMSLQDRTAPNPIESEPGFSSTSLQTLVNSNQTTIAAGKATGTINIDQFPDAELSGRKVNIILDTLNTSNTSYTVIQNAPVEAAIFQKTGSLSFSGSHTNLILNDAALSNTYLSATLLGEDTIWNGNGYADITHQGGSNVIVTNGRGSLSITGASQDSSASSLSPSDNSLKIYGLGPTEGNVTYKQGIENATISGLNSQLNAVLGQGSALIDTSQFKGNSDSFYNIIVGTGNVILENFLPKTAGSTNHISLGTDQNILSASYTNSGNTVYTLNTGNTVTLTHIDTHTQSIFI